MQSRRSIVYLWTLQPKQNRCRMLVEEEKTDYHYTPINSRNVYEGLSRMPSQNDRASLYSHLRDYGRFSGICWLMCPEPAPAKPLPISTVEEIIFSEEFLSIQGYQSQIEYLHEKLKVNINLIPDIGGLTKGQRDNPLWHLVRKGRLTASNFGCVLNAKRATPSLIKRLLGEYDISRVKAVLWGTTNENEAVKTFVMQTGLPVEETGVWLDQSGVLGASPDGFVGQNHVLEVKCPFTQRNTDMNEAVKHNGFCLKMNDDAWFICPEKRPCVLAPSSGTNVPY